MSALDFTLGIGQAAAAYTFMCFRSLFWQNFILMLNFDKIYKSS